MVYLIEDDAALRGSIEGLLSAAGLSVQSFESAPEFLNRQRCDALCCLVLDVNLPGTTGLELQEDPRPDRAIPADCLHHGARRHSDVCARDQGGSG